MSAIPVEREAGDFVQRIQSQWLAYKGDNFRLEARLIQQRQVARGNAARPRHSKRQTGAESLWGRERSPPP